MTQEVAKIILKHMSTEDLCRLYDKTHKDNTAQEVMETALIHGWIMEELKQRDPIVYRQWIQDKSPSPTPYYSKEE